MKIVSGGQTGVDRAALDAAIDCDISHGGWCPENRKAEDGVINGRYQLESLVGGGYAQRTKANVRDSDGTLIIYFGQLKGGTEQTLSFCIRKRKPYKLIDADEITEERAAYLVAKFCAENSVSTLNVAGPRQSSHAKAHSYTYTLMCRFLNQVQTVN